MIINAQVPLHRLLLTLSEALDGVHPAVADHQHRVAYISISMCRAMGMANKELFDVFRAAVLHDLGLIRVENRLLALRDDNLEAVQWHAEAGFELLKDNPLLAQAAEAVRFHHQPWAYGQGAEHDGRRVPFASHVIVLADYIERAIDREVHILDQAKEITQRITRLGEAEFHPDCVEALREVARRESFWLDCVSERIYSVLLDQVADWPLLTIDEKTIEPIAEMFARVVDAASSWTATHTSGVAASAVALAERMNFSPRELLLMRAAGYFHDLGKLTVPSRILDKPGKLTPQEWSIMKGHTYHTFRVLNTIGGMPQMSEWAAFHHERLDGNGYPFHHEGKDLTLGARIMAVADVFTAISEDRPYRPGMSRAKALSVLEDQAQQGALDADIVSVLKADFDQIDAIRRKEQALYARTQQQLTRVIGQPGTAVNHGERLQEARSSP